MDIEKVKRCGIIKRIIRFLNKDYSTCQTCGLPWNHCEQHNVKLESGMVVFAVCEYCYRTQDSVELAKAYNRQYDVWYSNPHIGLDKKTYVKAFVKDINNRLKFKKLKK